MTPQELKNSILQLAIQGKLVEQRAEEGTAEVLYKKIQEEKQKLIKEGKIKKQKSLPDIAEDEIPFDIPESWKWVRLGDCSSYSQSKPKIKATDITAEMWSLDLEDIEKETGRIINVCKASERKIAGEKVCFYKDQILYSKLRPYLKKIIVAPSDGICTPELVPFRMYGNIDNRYITYVLKSPHVDYVINTVTYGVKMPRAGTDTMVNLLIPLPPLEEQKRIVAKIEALLPLIEKYESAWTKLEEFNKKFPDDLQKSILQMAIQGKLVEQRSDEGTAEELYMQIQEEKRKLIEEGKIKKPKPLPEITEDEIPFDIPESWTWVRLGDLSKLVTKGSSPKWQGINYIDDGLLFVTSENVGSRELIWNNRKFVDERFNELSPRSRLKKYDLLTNIVGASIGRTAIYDLDDDANINQAVCLIRLINTKLLDYILMYMNSTVAYSIMMNDKVDTARANISLTNICEFPVPLPPLEEQKRIVGKIEELLPLCNRLK